MKTIIKKYMKVLMVALMLLIPLGINNSVVYAEPDPSLVKTLEKGVVYYVGDYIKIEGQAYIREDGPDYGVIQSGAGSYELLAPEYKNYGFGPVWWFNKIIYSIIYGCEYGMHFGYGTTIDETNPPIGIKCVDGNGTEDNPFTFELIYSLAKGDVYNIGDTVYLGKNVWIDFDDDPNYDERCLGLKGDYTVPTPEFCSSDQWMFEDFIYTGEEIYNESLCLGYGSATETNVPIGIKCVDGDGTENNPFTFELVYSTTTISSYKVTEGDGSSWTKGSTTTLDFRCLRTPEVDFDEYNTRLTSVVIDKEIELNTEQYEIASGSIIVKLKPELLQNLSQGSHTLTLIFDDGSAPANFTIKTKQDNPTPNHSIPKTGVE